MRRLGELRNLLWLTLLALSGWSCVCLHRQYEEENQESPQEELLLKEAQELGVIPSPASPPDSRAQRETAVAPTKWKLVRYGYGIQPCKTIVRYATCYPDHPSDIEKRKPYANRKYPFIPRRETRIRRTDYTVAVNFKDRWMNDTFIMINGQAINKFYVHVPDYNKRTKEDMEHLDWPYDPYLSVPRDVMPDIKAYLKPPRIDVLFTTAGKYFDIKQRQHEWAKMYTHKHQIEVWEIFKYRLETDGTRQRKVKCIDFHMVDCGKDKDDKTIWAKMYE